MTAINQVQPVGHHHLTVDPSIDRSNNFLGMLVLILVSTFAIASHQEFELQLQRPIYWPSLRHQIIPLQYHLVAPPPLSPVFQGNIPQSRNNWRKEPARNQDVAKLRFNSILFLKSATFTVTTTVNITSIRSCIPVSLFNGNSYSTTCSRKKREDSSRKLLNLIDPTEPQQLTMTSVPSFVGQLERGNGQHLVYDRDLISSSKDDVTDQVTERERRSEKQNRFLYFNWTYTTEYVFVLNTFYVTKQVILAGNGQLTCRLSDYPICT